MINLKKRLLKKICAALTLGCLLASLALPLSSCSGEGNGDKITVLCTVFPQYDWAASVAKGSENLEVLLLVENGADLHGYQPSVEDMVKIKQSDAVIFIGGESDAWVRDALTDAKGAALSLSELDGITLREVSEEHIYSGEEHDHDHGKTDSHGAFDEHLWLSVKNAEVAVAAICDTLCELDSENSELYRANAAEYTAKLQALDGEFESAAREADKLTLFADRFPFVYLFEDYGLDYAAAFEGCSADAEADFSTITRLADLISAHGLSLVAVTESSDERLAQSVISAAEADCEIVAFDSMQSVTKAQIADGYGYIGAMEANLSALKKTAK